MDAVKEQMFIQQAIAGIVFLPNFVTFVVGALLAFLLTSWRKRLTWADWTIALVFNAPAASALWKLLFEAPYNCDGYCYLLVLCGIGFGLGLLLGLLLSRWFIAVGREV